MVEGEVDITLQGKPYTLKPGGYAFIPPGADYDPGPPSVQLPPGVPAGPGPAPNAPFPLPYPPSDPGPQPLPWPFFAPPDQVTPPYAINNPPAPGPEGQPQASGPKGPQSTTYDANTGVFADPAGGTGVFNAGSSNGDAGESWVDLMKDPRQV